MNDFIEVEVNDKMAFKNCFSLRLNVPSTVMKIASDAFLKVLHVEYRGSAIGSPWGANSMN